MQVLKYILVLLEVLVLFNLIIFVHELGHFLAARWRGLKIERFAIWFGKPIWKKKINGVEYALGSIPAGGYVSLPQMATMEMIEGKGEGESDGKPLAPISPLDKIIVAVAGPLFSLLLGFAFAVIVWQVGKPADKETTMLGWVEPGGPAAKAGLKPGDVITKIDGHRVTRFAPPPADESIIWRIISSEGANITFNFLRDGQEHVTEATPYKAPTHWYERKALRKVQISPASNVTIGEVISNSPAAIAGLQKGDEVLSLNGEKLFSPWPIIYKEERMTNGPLEPMKFEVARGAERLNFTLTPEIPLSPTNKGPSIGIASFMDGDTNVALAHPSPMEQVKGSVNQIFATISAVFSRKGDVGVQQLGGAVMIIRLYSNLFQSENGWRMVLWFSVVLNVNLALLNMLPFPVLDGGHILLAMIEGIRRRPVSAKILQVLQTACAMILIGFMVFLAFYDAGDWVRSAHKNAVADQPVVFAPKH